MRTNAQRSKRGGPAGSDIAPSAVNLVSLSIETSTGIVAVLAPTGMLLSCSAGLCEVSRRDPSALRFQPFEGFGPDLGLESWSAITEEIDRAGVFRLSPSSGDAPGTLRAHVVNIYPSLGPSGFPNAYILLAQPGPPPRSQDDSFETQAFVDPLTRLFNRRFLETSVEPRFAAGNRLGFLLIDVDHFNHVNDRHGHATGDLVLKHVADAITEAIPLGDTAIRLGGDAFVVIVDDFDTEADLAAIATDIRAAVALPARDAGEALSVSTSIGIARCPEHGQSLEALLAHADNAMYEQRRGGWRRGPVSSNSLAAPCLSEDLAHDLRAGRIRPYYQPIVSLQTGRNVGVEALARWDHAERGLLHPSEFMPLAERNGLMGAIDRAMFDAICRDLARWDDAHARHRTFFNLSADTLRDPSTPDHLRETLARHGLAPGLFNAEITETMALNAQDPARDCVARLDALGMSVALDDFGTGFSSLALLKTLPVTWVKIDRSFVRDLTQSHKDRSIVESMLHLTESFGATLIAEGVETEMQRRALIEIGVQFGQGYLFGQAEPFEKLRGTLGAFPVS